MARKAVKEAVVAYAGILVGSAVLAVALDAFTVPNRIAAGGVSGLATILYHQFGWPVGMVMLAVNIPLFAAGIKALGTSFGMRTVIGTIASSVFVDLFAPFLPVLTEDPVLASVYGGVLTGVGVGITFRFGGSTGGTDIAALLIHHFTRLGVGRSFILIDGLVILWAAAAFNAELAMYAFLSLVIASWTIDLIQEGRPFAKGALIISDEADAIAKEVLETLERGVTAFRGQGAYTGKERDALVVIVGRHQIHQLAQIVRSIDPRAFMVVADVSDVMGEGFERGKAK